MPFLLAETDIPAIIGVMTGFGLCVVLPIIAMLLSHQRRMAELVNGQSAQRGVSDQRIARLEEEVGQLRQQLTDNILAFDDHRGIQQSFGPPPIPEQVKSGR